MAKKASIHLPLKYVEQMLKALGLRYSKKDLPDGKGVQLRLTEDAFSIVSVNVYHGTHSVLVQPHDAPEAEFVRTVFRLRCLRLRQKGIIS